MENKSESLKGKFAIYGMPRLSTSTVLGVVDMALLTIYTLGYGLFPLFAGIAMGMGKLAIAVSQFLMGWLSDKINTKYGKRKPFMILCSPILGVSFVFLMIPTVFISNPTDITLFIWVLIWDFIFQFFYGALTTPYQSWVAEQFEVKFRPKASAFQNLFGFLGTGVGVVFAFLIVPSFRDEYQASGQIIFSYTLLTIIFAILIVALYYACAYLLPVEPLTNLKMDFILDVKQLLKDKNFMKVCLLQGIAFLAWGMVTPTLLGFTTEVLNFETSSMVVAAGVLFLGIMVFLFTWKRLIEKKGKKTTISLIFLLAVIILPFSLIGLIPGGVSFPVAIIYVVGVAACLGGWYLFPYIWYADLAEDAKKRGDVDEMKAGLYAGFPNILLNIFQAIALVITGAILALPNVPGKTFSWGYVLWGVWCSAVLLIGLIYIRKYISLDFDWEKKQK